MISSPYLHPYEFDLYTINNAVVDSGRHVVISGESPYSDKEICNRLQSLSISKYNKAIESSIYQTDVEILKADDVLYVPTYWNFYHCIIDGLPRAYAAFGDRKLDLVLSDYIKAYNKVYEAVIPWLPCNSLATYPIHLNKRIDYSTNSRLIANKMSFLSTTASSKEPMDISHINKRIALAFWHRFADDHWPKKAPTKKLFIRRTINNPKNNTRCRNQDEVFDYLSKYHGFESWDPTNHTFVETAMTFSEASFIVGVHGAALSSIAFCQHGTKVIELISMGGKSTAFFGPLAKPGGFKYAQLIGYLPGKSKKRPKDFDDEFNINISELASLVGSF